MRAAMKGRAVSSMLVVIVVAFVTAMLTVVVATASAEITHPFKSRITEGCSEPAAALKRPQGLTFDSNGHLFVTEPIGKVVEEYSSANACLGQLGAGLFPEQAAYSVTVNNANGDVYVGESGPEDVFVFKPEGVGKYKLVQKAHIEGFIFLAFDNSSGPDKDDLYVVDGPDHVYVAKTNAEGLLGEGNVEENFINEEGEVALPKLTPPPSSGGFSLSIESRGGIAVNNSTGELYLAEPGHFDVSVYGPEGVFQKKIEGGESPAKSFEPIDVAVEEATGDIYVVDFLHKVVDQYSSEGKYLGQIKGISEAEPFGKPLGVAVQNAAGPAKGEVYVADGAGIDVFEAPPKPKFPLTVKVVGTGSGKVVGGGISCPGTCSSNEAEGEVVALTATPAAGSSFAGWSGACSGVGACEVTISAAREVTAEFTLNPPVNTGLPVISGTAQAGHTLSATKGSWEGSPSSYMYQWEDCNASGEACSNIALATGSEYTLTEGDVGHTIRVAVTAKNAGGTSSPAVSAATAVVEPGASNQVNITVEGKVPFTQSLTAGCTNVNLGEFVPALTATYTNTCLLTATSTTAESKLVAEDTETSNHEGHLVNEGGKFFLPKALETKATDSQSIGGGGALTPLTSPVTLQTYGTPVSADEVTETFQQQISKTDGLHTGRYAKTITVTLQTTTP